MEIKVIVVKIVRLATRRDVRGSATAKINSISQGPEQVKRYQGMRFLSSIADKDYNVVRSMFSTAGYPEFSDFIGE